jgi:hypothetical protein
MKKTILFVICSLFISITSFGQTSTEYFETEAVGSTSFTDNGVVFNIISHSGTFDMYYLANGGWNGTAIDTRFIDNSSSIGPNASFSIKTTSNLFKVNRFWVFTGNNLTNPNTVGTLNVTGKLNGVTKFSQTKTTGFTTSVSVNNGYTLIDLTNLNGQNYSNIVIDQLQLTVGGNYQYLALDAFTWVKDSGIVLATNEAKASEKGTDIYPNPTNGPLNIKATENTKLEVYSQSGQLVKTIEAKKGNNEADISALSAGTYFIKSNSGSYKVIKK